ncbi:DUF1501 domain-containing protein [Ferrimonas pelagia]|uniref:DUF1501 domain-containing protein n=1 Tax=Ferrimonas pelagia TaxID=1177826 RepID=A0ABP9EHA7_9GAMM
MKRRQFLQGSASLLALSALPMQVWGSGEQQQRFIWITLRGAWDGLSVVVPTDEPQLKAARPTLLPALLEAGPTPLGQGFALHPALPTVAKLVKQQQACAHLAVATQYRQRSHFDGQAYLESGATSGSTGWLNTLASVLDVPAEAVGPRLPLIARGEAPIAHQIHNRLASPSEQRLALLREWYQDEPYLTGLLQQAQALPEQQPGKMAAQARALAEAMADDRGPVLAALELSGWDSHANQHGLLIRRLEQLDGVIAALIAGLGKRWPDTQIWIASEFGRTVKENGTKGTDHGTGGLALQLSGAGQLPPLSGRWPGLSEQARYEGRDLMPTQDLHDIVHAGLERHFARPLPPLLS